jgi:hypothetical protein
MNEGGGFGRDPGTRRRRMLPAVTDVVRELARTISTDPAVLFRAARSVVGDELARVKQGFESAPLNVLVKRARRQLEQDGVAVPAADAEEPPQPKSISIPAPPLKPNKPAAPAADDPFRGAGAADLGWEKDIDIQQDDAPFWSAILPLPQKARGAQEIVAREKTTDPEPVPPPPLSPQSRLPVPERVTAPEGLAVERSGPVKPPKHRIEDLPLFSKPEPPRGRPTLAPPPPPPPPAPEPPVRAEAPEPHWEPPAPPFEPPERVTSEMPPPANTVGQDTEPVEPAEPEMREFAFKAAEKPQPPKKGDRTGWIVAVAVVLAVAAGLVWAVRTFLSGGVVRKVEAPAPAPAPKKQVEAAPAPAPVPAPAASAAPAPTKAAPVPKVTPVPKAAPGKAASAPVPGAPVPKGKAAPLLTPDWSGKSVVYVVHFSSHRDRPSAEKEAKRLATQLGKPGRAVEVDLGDKGVWFRVVIGEFATVEEARAYRADLEAKKTPGLGFAYEMRGR